MMKARLRGASAVLSPDAGATAAIPTPPEVILRAYSSRTG